MTATAAGATSDQAGHVTGYGTKPYRSFVLLSLMLVYTLNFVDRTLISVVAQPIINTFELNDFQWGLLAGPPFALFYAAMGIPIAMWADRSNRIRIIAVCVILWSVMTALCGLAVSFTMLLLFRIGVAIGEAGCTPPANSIIGDYYPARSRVNALGIYSMGVTLGAVLAQLFGGAIAGLTGPQFGAWLDGIGLGLLFSGLDWTEIEGWRIAFVVIGLPGVFVALMVWLTIEEPPRGYSDPPSTSPQPKAGFGEAFKELARKPSFWWMTMGASLVAFVGYGLINFQAPFLQRVHGIDVREAAIFYGAPFAVAAAIGTFAGGFFSERLAPRFPTVVAWLPGVGLLAAIPLYIGAFYSTDLTTVFVLWCLAAVAHYAYLGAQYTIGQGVVSARSRATAIAILLLIVSLVGNGIGPPFVGLLSDIFMKVQMSAAGLPESFSVDVCKARDLSALTDAQQLACREAYGGGLKQSMAATVLIFIIAATGYFLSARFLRRDMVAGT